MLIMEWDSERLGCKVQREWHIGEPVPAFEGYVITFHADLDELNCLVSAMVASTGAHPRVDYTKQKGLHAK